MARAAHAHGVEQQVGVLVQLALAVVADGERLPRRLGHRDPASAELRHLAHADAPDAAVGGVALGRTIAIHGEGMGERQRIVGGTTAAHGQQREIARENRPPFAGLIVEVHLTEAIRGHERRVTIHDADDKAAFERLARLRDRRRRDQLARLQRRGVSGTHISRTSTDPDDVAGHERGPALGHADGADLVRRLHHESSMPGQGDHSVRRRQCRESRAGCDTEFHARCSSSTIGL